MHPSCLEYCLTEAERQAFDENGYLIVEDVLPPALIAQLAEALDRLYAEKRANGLGPHDNMFYPNFVARDDTFVELVDWPRTLPKVWGIMSWNLQLYHSHCGVNHPAHHDADRTPKALGWHQDSGRVNVEMESGAGQPRPRLSLKVAYFLSDVSEPGRGNFHILPGSHLQDRIDRPT